MHKRIIYSFFSLFLVSLFFYLILSNQYQDTRFAATCRIIDSTHVNISLNGEYKIVQYPNTFHQKEEFDCWVRLDPLDIEWNLKNYYKLVDHIVVFLALKIIIVLSALVIVFTFVSREIQLKRTQSI